MDKMTPERVIERLGTLVNRALGSDSFGAAAEYTAMAKTVRTLQGERDRLREAAQFVTDAVTTVRQFEREYPMDIDSQSCAEEALWLALASLAAALHPEPLGEGGGL